MYLQDYDGVYPDSADCSPIEPRRGWVAGALGEKLYPEKGTIYPYVRDLRVYMCPSDPYGRQTGLSYGMNNLLAACALNPLNESDVRAPASTVLLVENPFLTQTGMTSSAFAGGNEWFPPDFAVPCYPQKVCKEPVVKYGCMEPVACRHNGAVTVLFCDMHVKTHPPGTLLNRMFCPYPGRSFESG